MARHAFASRGYSSVRLEEVARAARATTGAIYHHFGGKAGLMLAVGETVEREVTAEIGARIPEEAEPWEAIRAACLATLEVCSRADVANIIFKEAPNSVEPAVWREVEARYGAGGLGRLLERASRAGQLTPDAPALVARILMAALREAVAALIDEPTAGTRATLQEAVSKIIAGFSNR